MDDSRLDRDKVKAPTRLWPLGGALCVISYVGTFEMAVFF